MPCCLQRKIDHGDYFTPGEFASDVRLVFTNCYKYNPPDHDFVTMAKRLQFDVFEMLYARMPEEPEKIEAVDDFDAVSGLFDDDTASIRSGASSSVFTASAPRAPPKSKKGHQRKMSVGATPNASLVAAAAAAAAASLAKDHQLNALAEQVFNRSTIKRSSRNIRV